MKNVAVMYSGGTDSTAAVALIADQFDKIDLVTCTHSGLSNINNSAYNLPKLQELFGRDKFNHIIFDVDSLFKRVTYAEYFRYLKQFGLFNLTSCGLCKLAMHLRTLIHCLDSGIQSVADGANKNMSHFPAQMIEVIDELRKMYDHFGIEYLNPVFDYEFPEDIDWVNKLGLASLPGVESIDEQKGNKTTTGQVLTKYGILKKENVKGTETDRKMQGRCFQLTLLNIFALGYYIPTHGIERYRENVLLFYKQKIALFTQQVEQYLENRQESTLSKVIGPGIQ